MNVGSGNYHLDGPTYTYKDKTVPCLVDYSEIEGISGHILMNVIWHLDDLK